MALPVWAGPVWRVRRPVPDLNTFVNKRAESIAAQLAGKSKGYTPAAFGGPGFGGPGMGGPGFGGPRPNPGEVLAPPVQNALQMTAAQKKELAELQKKVDAELEKILTPEQRAQLKRMREGGGMGMGGFPGGPPPKP